MLHVLAGLKAGGHEHMAKLLQVQALEKFVGEIKPRPTYRAQFVQAAGPVQVVNVKDELVDGLIELHTPAQGKRCIRPRPRQRPCQPCRPSGMVPVVT